RFCFWHNQHFTHHLPKTKLREWRVSKASTGRSAEVHESGDVFRVDDADDVIWSAHRVIYRDARMQFFHDARAGCFDQHVGREREDALPGCHDLARWNLIDFDGAVYERFLKLWQHADAPC